MSLLLRAVYNNVQLDTVIALSLCRIADRPGMRRAAYVHRDIVHACSGYIQISRLISGPDRRSPYSGESSSPSIPLPSEVSSFRTNVSSTSSATSSELYVKMEPQGLNTSILRPVSRVLHMIGTGQYRPCEMLHSLSLTVLLPSFENRINVIGYRQVLGPPGPDDDG